MNLEEARCCWFDQDLDIEELSKSDELDRKELPKFARHCLDKGVKAVYITLDEQGCAVYFKADSGKPDDPKDAFDALFDF